MNKELYIAAMDHLPVSQDFTGRVMEKMRKTGTEKRKRARPAVFAAAAFAALALFLCFLPGLNSFWRSGASGSGLAVAGCDGGNDFGPGVKRLSACGNTLYFQPYYGRAKTNSVFCWDGKTLTETQAGNADSMFAYPQGCYYISRGILYRYEKSGNQVKKIRDLNADRRLGDISSWKGFTVRLFYADRNGIYAACYGSGENEHGPGVAPFFLLRVSPDGAKSTVIYADGKGEAGTYLSDIKVLNNRIYYSHSGGIYSLAMDGSGKRLVTANIPRIFFGYNGGLVFIGQQPNQPDPADYLYILEQGSRKEKQICKISSTTFFCLQGNRIYYSNEPDDHTVMYNGIYAYDLKTGKSEYVMDDKQESEEYTGDYYYQAAPAENGIFMVHMAGEVCYYNSSTKKSISIYGGKK